MVAIFDYLPLVYDDDAVYIGKGTQSVRNMDNGLIFQNTAEGFLYLSLCEAVYL